MGHGPVPPLGYFEGNRNRTQRHLKTMKQACLNDKVIAVFILILFGLLGASAAADGPTAQIKSTVDRVITLLADPKLHGEAKTLER